MANNERKFIPELRIENAHILFKNFSGAPTQFNPKGGKRTFCVILDPNDAALMAEDGWNIKYLQPRPDDGYEEATPYMSVNVAFGDYPPQVNYISGNTMTQLDETTIDILDQADLETVDLVIRPYSWNVQGNSGISAYLKAGYFTAKQDSFADKYAKFMQHQVDNGNVPF